MRAESAELRQALSEAGSFVEQNGEDCARMTSIANSLKAKVHGHFLGFYPHLLIPYSVGRTRDRYTFFGYPKWWKILFANCKMYALYV